LAFVDTPFTLTNSVITDNIAYIRDPAVGGVFAGINGTNPVYSVTSNNSPGILVNNTIANNNGDQIDVAAATTIFNNIIVAKNNNTTGLKLTGTGPVTAVYNGFYNTSPNASGVTLDNTNIVIDPQLTSDYHLTAASPMIDAGTHGPVLKAGSMTGETVSIPGTDVDGEPRR